MQPGVREVWARAAWAAADTARAAGLPVQAVFAGLPFDERSMQRKTRVPWDDYVMIIDRMNMMCGGPMQLELLLESVYHKVLPEVRTLAGAAVTPERLVRFIFEVLDPFVFPMVSFRVSDLGDDRLRLDTRLQPGYRPCEPFFASTRGAIRSMTRHLDLPPVEIVTDDVGPTHGIYDVRLPEPPSFVQRAGRIPSAVRKLVMRVALGATSDGTPLTIQLDEQTPDPIEARIRRTTTAWGLSTRERELLRLVVEGQTDRSIASTFGMTIETLEAHLAELATKANAPSRTHLIVQFWTTSLDS